MGYLQDYFVDQVDQYFDKLADSLQANNIDVDKDYIYENAFAVIEK
jgi:hypothetical protein